MDIETGEILSGQSILINNHTIADIFDDNVKTPAVSKSIAMDGKYAIPGLWDMHIHLRGGEDLMESNRSLLPLYIANGVTTVRDAGGDLTPSILKWQYEINSASMIGPDIYTSWPKIDGPDATWEGSIEVVSKNDINAALDSLESLKVDYVKIYDSQLSGEVYLEIIRQAENRGLTVTGHMPMSVNIEDALTAGLDGIEHLYYVLKGTSTHEEEISKKVKDGEMGFWSAVAALKNSYNEDLAQQFYQKLAD